MLSTRNHGVFKNDGTIKVWHITSGVSAHSAPSTREMREVLTSHNDLPNTTDVHFFVSSLAAQYGFQCSSTYTFIPSFPQSHAVYLSSAGWNFVRYYRENACFKNDASLRHVRSQRTPFSWDPVYYRKAIELSLSPAERSVISRVIEYGVSQIACMPFHGATGDRGAFRFLRIGIKPLDPGQMANFFHETFYLFHLMYEQQLRLLTKELELEQDSLLSAKEICVLNLYANGDNPPRIADQLGISQHTVQQHLRNIRNKLGVRTTVHAVKKASVSGLLEDV